jgi:hypothetical protein
MKPSLKRWMNSSFKIAVFVMGITFLVSCEDQLTSDDRSPNEQVLAEQSSPLNFSAAAMSCADNLANDGCNFTSGTGRDHPNQFLMVSMMNNCRTESLPPNCSWDGNQTQTRTMEVDLNNCCYPFNTFNAVMNGWKSLAQSNRPAGNYLITNYQRINGYMVTVYGPYRMVISVTYRKKGLCALIGEEVKDKIDFHQ